MTKKFRNQRVIDFDHLDAQHDHAPRRETLIDNVLLQSILEAQARGHSTKPQTLEPKQNYRATFDGTDYFVQVSKARTFVKDADDFWQHVAIPEKRQGRSLASRIGRIFRKSKKSRAPQSAARARAAARPESYYFEAPEMSAEDKMPVIYIDMDNLTAGSLQSQLVNKIVHNRIAAHTVNDKTPSTVMIHASDTQTDTVYDVTLNGIDYQVMFKQNISCHHITENTTDEAADYDWVQTVAPSAHPKSVADAANQKAEIIHIDMKKLNTLSPDESKVLVAMLNDPAKSKWLKSSDGKTVRHKIEVAGQAYLVELSDTIIRWGDGFMMPTTLTSYDDLKREFGASLPSVKNFQEGASGKIKAGRHVVVANLDGAGDQVKLKTQAYVIKAQHVSEVDESDEFADEKRIQVNAMKALYKHRDALGLTLSQDDIQMVEDSPTNKLLNVFGGQSLKEFLKANGSMLDVDQRIKIARAILKTYQVLQQENVFYAHYDLAPRNMVIRYPNDDVTADPQIMIIDFDRAIDKAILDAESQKTNPADKRVFSNVAPLDVSAIERIRDQKKPFESRPIADMKKHDIFGLSGVIDAVFGGNALVSRSAAIKAASQTRTNMVEACEYNFNDNPYPALSTLLRDMSSNVEFRMTINEAVAEFDAISGQLASCEPALGAPMGEANTAGDSMHAGAGSSEYNGAAMDMVANSGSVSQASVYNECDMPASESPGQVDRNAYGGVHIPANPSKTQQSDIYPEYGVLRFIEDAEAVDPYGVAIPVVENDDEDDHTPNEVLRLAGITDRVIR
jgi:hypothetical protein